MQNQNTQNAQNPEPPKEVANSFPQAHLRKKRHWTILWVIPIFALGVAGWLIYREFVHTGYEITIRFHDATGLEPTKSQVFYRGVPVGLVRDIKLAADRKWSLVKVAMEDPYKDLAREGTLFWVVKPRISATEVRGLATIASQNYIELELGNGPAGSREFQGQDQPPVTSDTSEPPKGLRIKLVASRRAGLKSGSRIYYRGVQAGMILAYDVAPDASAVVFDAVIQEKFATLVHPDSKFWNVGGVDFSAGIFKGLDLKMNDIESLLAGGVEFATPASQRGPAREGSVFPIYSEPKDEWKQWRANAELRPGTNTSDSAEQETERTMQFLRESRRSK